MKLNTSVASVSRRARRAKKTVGARRGRFPIVGIGASAGGLEAFVQLLENLPPDTGMAFVFVQHLHPGQASALPHLLSRATSMSVREPAQGVVVRPNEVYVIPPGSTMTLVAGRLRLTAREPRRTPSLSIDVFFQSLAREQEQRAIGVVFSGNAADGTQGLEAIRAEGGITFAQDKSAQYDSMPRHAIAAGCVDHVLGPAAIARELTRIAGHPYLRQVPPTLPRVGKAAGTAAATRPGADGEGSGLAQIMDMLQKHCGVDFSLYKPGTIHRRITRRMLLRRKESLEDYARLVKSDTSEVKALCSDLLINVTSFFRDEAAFAAVKRIVFERMLTERRGGTRRIWTIGCSGGQEAYSLAIAFLEVAETYPHPAPRVQIFGTDLSETLLNRARRGLYPKTLAQEISAVRLKKYFVEEAGGYRVTKLLRDMCVFGRQDILGGPPFSRMDLVSCRNVLIYLDATAQKRIMPTLHYALRPDGYLFLGTSESVGGFSDLFEPADRKQKIFRRKSTATPRLYLPLRPQAEPDPAPALGRRLTVVSPGGRTELQAQHKADRLMVDQFAPPGVLVDASLKVLEFRGVTAPFLSPQSGKASFDLLKLAREGLVLPLRSAIDQARKRNRPARREKVRVDQRTNLTVNLQVIPLQDLHERFFLVVFEPSGPNALPVPLPVVPVPRGDRQLRRRNHELERELRELRDYLQSLQQQHDSAHDEMQASIEEAQSTNEELQTVNEELETTKEELESGNEELITVNEEMTFRVGELNRLNADLVDFHASLDTPIVMLDGDLTIRRFTPAAEKIFNLLNTDLGRPLSGIKHNLRISGLERLVARVVAGRKTVEQQVEDKSGHRYLLRIRPYLDAAGKCAGAILLLVEMDELARARRRAAGRPAVKR